MANQGAFSPVYGILVFLPFGRFTTQRLEASRIARSYLTDSVAQVGQNERKRLVILR